MADFLTAVSLWPSTRPSGKQCVNGILLWVNPLQKPNSPPRCHFVAMGMSELERVVICLALLNATTIGNSFLSLVTESQLQRENRFHLENI